MTDSGKLVFLSPSDFRFGDVSFEPGLYQVQQIGEGLQHTLVFTRIAGFVTRCVPYPWSAEVFCDEDDVDRRTAPRE